MLLLNKYLIISTLTNLFSRKTTLGGNIMSKNCNCIYDETCICPDPASCAFNDFSELDTDVQTEPDPSKDR